MLASILASSHPYILRFICVCLHPCILTSSYTQVLVSSYPHILTSLCHIPRFVCVCLYPRILTSHTLRFMRVCWYPCILISSDSCVFPFILASSHPHMLIFVCACILASSYPQTLGLCDLYAD